MSRQSWDLTFFEIAETMSRRATCPRLHNGAVIVSYDKQIVATGYNGAPRRLEHCDEVGCLIEGGHCVRAVHAEANAVLQSARRGISLTQSPTTLYTLHRPCIRCAMLLVQAGITTICYKYEYESDGSRDQVMAFLKSASVVIWSPEHSTFGKAPNLR